jgi:gluconolactonase
MFAAPPVIETQLRGRLPERFHVHGRNCDRYGTRKLYIEGPALARDGTLYFVDVPAGRIFAMHPDGDFELIVEYDGHPNGLKVHRDGRVFIADYKNGIMFLDPSTRKVEPFLTRIGNERLNGPNDLTFATNGDIYFTDQGNSDIIRQTGRVVRVGPRGQWQILLAGVPSPNGLVLSPDEKTLYVAVTRTNNVWKAPLDPPNGLLPFTHVGTTGIFIQMSGGSGPDGMAVDEAGNIAVAHSGLGCAWLFSPVGEPLYRIKSCAGLSISNMVYGGPDRKTLYLTESSTGSILTAQMPVAGRKLYADLD